MCVQANGVYYLYDGDDPVCELDSNGNAAWLNCFPKNNRAHSRS